MRVLHLWDNYAPGLFDHSLAICREEGVVTALVCMNLIGDCDDADVRFVRQLDKGSGPNGPFARAARRLRAKIDERRFRHLVQCEIDRFKPDLLHIHFGTTGALLTASERVLRIPFIISFYGFDISQGFRAPSIRAAYRTLMKHRPLVHVLCAEAAERVLDLGATADRIVDANLPLPVDRYPSIGIEAPQVSRWLIPARFVAKKGHEVLLEAFRSHLAAWPDHRLTCWGYGDGAWLRRGVAAFGLSKQVAVINNELEGAFDAAYLARLRDHDAVLAPSVRSPRGDDEGGPALTAVLAQVAGKPVIVSDFPGSERSVSDGVEGLVVRQGDAEALRTAMGVLAADIELARAMGRHGRERSVREFDRATYRDALLSWYRRLAG